MCSASRAHRAVRLHSARWCRTPFPRRRAQQRAAAEDRRGAIDTGYACRADRETKMLTSTARPPASSASADTASPCAPRRISPASRMAQRSRHCPICSPGTGRARAPTAMRSAMRCWHTAPTRCWSPHFVPANRHSRHRRLIFVSKLPLALTRPYAVRLACGPVCKGGVSAMAQPVRFSSLDEANEVCEALTREISMREAAPADAVAAIGKTKLSAVVLAGCPEDRRPIAARLGKIGRPAGSLLAIAGLRPRLQCFTTPAEDGDAPRPAPARELRVRALHATVLRRAEELAGRGDALEFQHDSLEDDRASPGAAAAIRRSPSRSASAWA